MSALTDNTNTSPAAVTPAPEPQPPSDAPAFDPGLPMSEDNKKWGTYDEIAEYLTDSGSVRYLKDGEWVVINRDVRTGDILTVDITRLTVWNKPAVRWALEAWSDVTGIQFQYVEGEERLVDGTARYFIDDDNEVALTFTSNEDEFEISGAAINVPPLDGSWLPTSGEVGSYIHEIGHALGLGHPGPYGFYYADGTFVFDGFASAIFLNDSNLLTNMSYFSVASNPWVTGSEASNSVTPMIVDIIAVHNLFGAPTTTRAGDTVYGVGGDVDGYLGDVFAVWSNRLPVRFKNGHEGLSLVDLDSDDDLDLIIIVWSQELHRHLPIYLENKGTSTTPVFTVRQDAHNPFVRDNIILDPLIDAGDVDGDGDMDLVSGGNSGIRYIENTGTPTAPSFTEHVGDSNPFSAITLNPVRNDPNLVDLDNDGDQDLILTSNPWYVNDPTSTLRYFENTGTPIAPSFTERSGPGNPLTPLQVDEGGFGGWTAFADMDGDGDIDAFVSVGSLGEDDEGNRVLTGHKIDFYENTGTSTSPRFVEHTGAAYPFVTFSTELYTPPALGDLDGDGDADLILDDFLITGSEGDIDADGYVTNTLFRYHINEGRDEIRFTDDNTNNPNIRITLYDNGGIDTLNLSNDIFNQHLDLRPEGISSVYGLVKNLIIARDTVIEHAVAGQGDDVIVGNDVGNRLEGRAGNDILVGGPGNDLLAGNDGNDTLTGGPGADRLRGGAGNDTASWAGSPEGVTVRLHSLLATGGDAEGDSFPHTVAVAYRDADGLEQTESLPDVEHLIGSAHNDILAGDRRDNIIDGRAGDDTLYGGPGGGGDTLAGGPGNDRLYGGQGADTLTGGQGDDRLAGGQGADVFVFGPGDGADTVTDFSSGTDKIDLTGFDIDNIEDVAMRIGDDGVTIELADISGGTVLLADLTALPEAGDFLV